MWATIPICTIIYMYTRVYQTPQAPKWRPQSLTATVETSPNRSPLNLHGARIMLATQPRAPCALYSERLRVISGV